MKHSHRDSCPNIPTGLSDHALTAIINVFGRQCATNKSSLMADLCFESRKGTHDVWVCWFEQGENQHKLLVKQLHEHGGQAFSFSSTFALQQQLFKQKMAAEPLYYDENDGVWIEAFLAPLSAHSSYMPDAPTTAHLAKTLARLHQVKIPNCRQLEPLAQCRALLNRDANVKRDAQAQRATLMQHWVMLEAELDKPTNQSLQSEAKLPDTWVLCHNDLHIEHIRGEYQCVDWEYSAVAPRYFDLATCIVINQLSISEQADLLRSYAQFTHLDLAYVSEMTSFYLQVARLIEQVWLIRASFS